MSNGDDTIPPLSPQSTPIASSPDASIAAAMDDLIETAVTTRDTQAEIAPVSSNVVAFAAPDDRQAAEAERAESAEDDGEQLPSTLATLPGFAFFHASWMAGSRAWSDTLNARSVTDLFEIQQRYIERLFEVTRGVGRS